jgi:hypothetical protein
VWASFVVPRRHPLGSPSPLFRAKSCASPVRPRSSATISRAMPRPKASPPCQRRSPGRKGCRGRRRSKRPRSTTLVVPSFLLRLNLTAAAWRPMSSATTLRATPRPEASPPCQRRSPGSKGCRGCHRSERPRSRHLRWPWGRVQPPPRNVLPAPAGPALHRERGLLR